MDGIFLNAVTAQAQQNASKADAMVALYEDQKRRFIELTRSQYAVPLLDAVFRQPVFRTSQLHWSSGAPSKPTINTMIHALVGAGVIKASREGSGSRSSIYYLPELIALVEGRS